MSHLDSKSSETTLESKLKFPVPVVIKNEGHSSKVTENSVEPSDSSIQVIFSVAP